MTYVEQVLNAMLSDGFSYLSYGTYVGKNRSPADRGPAEQASLKAEFDLVTLQIGTRTGGGVFDFSKKRRKKEGRASCLQQAASPSTL